jgi:hypothetical protein
MWIVTAPFPCFASAEIANFEYHPCRRNDMQGVIATLLSPKKYCVQTHGLVDPDVIRTVGAR